MFRGHFCLCSQTHQWCDTIRIYWKPKKPEIQQNRERNGGKKLFFDRVWCVKAHVWLFFYAPWGTHNFMYGKKVGSGSGMGYVKGRHTHSNIVCWGVDRETFLILFSLLIYYKQYRFFPQNEERRKKRVPFSLNCGVGAGDEEFY